MRTIWIILLISVLTLSVGVILFITLKAGDAPEIIPAEQVEKNDVVSYKTIGFSVEERRIEAYTYGQGKIHIVFIGGIHGGYEWNSVLLAYQFMDYLNMYTDAIPINLTVTIIPSANPDGLYKVVGKEGRFNVSDIRSDIPNGLGRFNARGVDLNRNFDCKWKPESTWKNNIVSAGFSPFSEPEARAIRDFVAEHKPAAVVFWHSKSNAVYASECEGGILPETRDIMREYSRASGYSAIDSFDAYEITGDAEGWLASIGIPAITVELQTHEAIEWERNLAGIKALFEYYKYTVAPSL
jgi:g-D-glutamyl-meso-diaminopimelate peptidase